MTDFPYKDMIERHRQLEKLSIPKSVRLAELNKGLFATADLAAIRGNLFPAATMASKALQLGFGDDLSGLSNIQKTLASSEFAQGLVGVRSYMTAMNESLATIGSGLSLASEGGRYSAFEGIGKTMMELHKSYQTVLGIGGPLSVLMSQQKIIESRIAEIQNPLAQFSKAMEGQEASLASIFARISAADALALSRDYFSHEEIELPDNEEERGKVLARGFISKFVEAAGKRGLTLADVVAILTFIYTFFYPSFTDEDREMLEDTNAQVHKNGEALRDLGTFLTNINATLTEHIVEEEAKVAKVNALPRFIVISPRAILREAPNGKAVKVGVLLRDTQIARISTQGRWSQVHYGDPILGTVEQAWVWSGSLGALNSDE